MVQIVDDFVAERLQGKFSFGFLGDLQTGKMVFVKTGRYSWEKAFKFARAYLMLVSEGLADKIVLDTVKRRFREHGGVVLAEYSVEDVPYEQRLKAMELAFKDWLENTE